MRCRRWNIAFAGWICIVLLFVALSNYLVDPYEYFSYQSGNYDDICSISTTNFTHELKAEHVLHYGENYDAFLLGGSKAGAFRAESLQRLDGYRYYNMFGVHGNFSEYETVVNFLIKNASPKKILITLSGGEVVNYSRSQEDMNTRLPAVMTGESKFLEIVDLLFKDVSNCFSVWKERGFAKKTYTGPTGGERGLEKYYRQMKDRDAWMKFTQKSVMGSFKGHMKKLFTKNKKADYYQECLDSLERIKKLCDKNKIELQLIAIPSFFTKFQAYESTYYRKFLRDITDIIDYWDFSDYNDITLNPYNFYDETHFYYETADLIIDTIRGTDSYPGFGYYVTKENAAERAAQRQEQYDRLKEEYLSSGTIQLQTPDDESCLVRDRLGTD